MRSKLDTKPTVKHNRLMADERNKDMRIFLGLCALLAISNTENQKES